MRAFLNIRALELISVPARRCHTFVRKRRSTLEILGVPEFWLAYIEHGNQFIFNVLPRGTALSGTKLLRQKLNNEVSPNASTTVYDDTVLVTLVGL